MKTCRSTKKIWFIPCSFLKAAKVKRNEYIAVFSVIVYDTINSFPTTEIDILNVNDKYIVN